MSALIRFRTNQRYITRGLSFNSEQDSFELDKESGETKVVTLNFNDILATGETVSTVSVDRASGVSASVSLASNVATLTVSGNGSGGEIILTVTRSSGAVQKVYIGVSSASAPHGYSSQTYGSTGGSGSSGSSGGTHDIITDWDTELAGKENATAFTPTADYHPATKKYVDDAVVSAGGYNDEAAQDAVGGILTDSSEINFTYDDAANTITAALIAASIDESKLDTSVNASLDLADSALQSSAIGVSVQAYDANLPTWPSTVDATEVGYLNGVTSSIQTQLDAKAASSHTHAASDITSGTFVDARIAQSNVTQHQAALSITESQISDLGSYATNLAGLSDVDSTVGSPSDGDIMVYRSAGSDWVLEAKPAAGSNPAIADITDWPSGVDATEVGYLDGVTSAIQSQLDGKQASGSYEASNADILKADEGDNLTAGYTSDAYAHGTISSGTVTPAPATGEENFQTLTNGGAFTLAPPAGNCSVVIQVTNNASAGAITTSGFTLVDGDTISTTDDDNFFFFIVKCGSFSSLTVKALQ